MIIEKGRAGERKDAETLHRREPHPEVGPQSRAVAEQAKRRVVPPLTGWPEGGEWCARSGSAQGSDRSQRSRFFLSGEFIGIGLFEHAFPKAERFAEKFEDGGAMSEAIE